MKKNVLIIIVIIVISIFVSWSSFWGQYGQRDTVNIHYFPRQLGGWTSREMHISENDYEILETKNAFSRIYQSPQGEKIMLFIVYSQYNRKVSHPPEICYTGSGVTILNKTGMDFNLGPKAGHLGVARLTGQEGRAKIMIYYWFKVGSSFTPNYWKQQIMIALGSLLGRPVSSAMVRLSVVVDPRDPAKADRTALKFTELITPHLNQYLP